MKTYMYIVKNLVFSIAGLLAVLTLNSCDAGTPRSDKASTMTTGILGTDEMNADDQAAEPDSPMQSPSARSLQVNIDESGLTYEDLTIRLSNGTNYVYKDAPFGVVKVSIEDLPASVEELKNLNLPNGMTDIHQSPYLQPILLVAALNQMNYDKETAKAMLDYVGRVTKSENRDAQMVHFPDASAQMTDYYKSDWSQANQYKKFDKVRSWLEGAKYANNYTPAEKPYVMTMEMTNYSYTSDKDYVQLWIQSSQLSSKREIGVWKYDSDGDGDFDTFWCSTYLGMLHSLGEY
ncbi:MAG: hypothetical protein Q4E32_05670 [Bacteroidales bacterium]|nr:hypothetical protein [Bacteroidales bacterium]